MSEIVLASLAFFVGVSVGYWLAVVSVLSDTKN